MKTVDHVFADWQHVGLHKVFSLFETCIQLCLWFWALLFPLQLFETSPFCSDCILVTRKGRNPSSSSAWVKWKEWFRTSMRNRYTPTIVAGVAHSNVVLLDSHQVANCKSVSSILNNLFNWLSVNSLSC